MATPPTSPTAPGRPPLIVTLAVDEPIELVHAAFSLDGTELVIRDFDEPPDRLEAWRGATTPGRHQLAWALFGLGPDTTRFHLYGDHALELGDGGAEVVTVRLRAEGAAVVVAIEVAELQ